MSTIAFVPAPLYVLTHGSSWLRLVWASVPNGRQSTPRARGDHGMAPTPNSYSHTPVSSSNGMYEDGGDHLQSGEHLTLLLAVHEVVVVLHRDERRELVVDRVVCPMSTSILFISCSPCDQRGQQYILCIAWTKSPREHFILGCRRSKPLTLVRKARAHADIPHIPRLHDIVQRLHGLLDRRVIVVPVA